MRFPDFRKQYRIVRDTYCGYEAQFRVWWLPVWFQCSANGLSTNTSRTVEEAEAVASQHADGLSNVVKVIGRLP
jgi:hypothetical protein